MKFKTVATIALLLIVFMSVSGFAIYDYLAGFIIHGGRTRSDYYRPQEVSCNSWHLNETFFDHRDPLSSDTDTHIEIPSCEQAIKTPKVDHYVLNKDQMRIRYLVFPTQAALADDSPIWLHVHGITSSWLHGVRYLGAAQRLGFRLVVMELQNHGKSQRHREGSSWGCREKWDVISVLKDVQNRYPESSVLITASSMGTISTTQAAMTSPDAFSSVKALVYESPISSVSYTFRSAGRMLALPESITEFMLDLTLDLAKTRSSIDFKSCFPDPKSHFVDIPTLLLVSEQEYRKTALRMQFRDYPYHRWLEIYPLPRGTHSAYWNYQPEVFEHSIKRFWQQNTNQIFGR